MSYFALSQGAYQTRVGYLAALEHSQQLFAETYQPPTLSRKLRTGKHRSLVVLPAHIQVEEVARLAPILATPAIDPADEARNIIGHRRYTQNRTLAPIPEDEALHFVPRAGRHSNVARCASCAAPEPVVSLGDHRGPAGTRAPAGWRTTSRGRPRANSTRVKLAIPDPLAEKPLPKEASHRHLPRPLKRTLSNLSLRSLGSSSKRAKRESKRQKLDMTTWRFWIFGV